MKNIYELFRETGVVPVVVLDSEEQGPELARALLAGGVPLMEVTYRTAAAQGAIERIAREVPEMCVGAGTVLEPETASQAVQAGAQFIVSPGYSKELLSWCREREVVFFPGVATATELQTAVCDGMKYLKFFPAKQAGGAAMLKALGAVFSQVQFMPTGGIDAGNLSEYLSLPNVLACGGSWLCSKALIREGRYEEITAICRESIEKAAEIRKASQA